MKTLQKKQAKYFMSKNKNGKKQLHGNKESLQICAGIL